jgi:hypothetical protein
MPLYRGGSILLTPPEEVEEEEEKRPPPAILCTPAQIPEKRALGASSEKVSLAAQEESEGSQQPRPQQSLAGPGEESAVQTPPSHSQIKQHREEEGTDKELKQLEDIDLLSLQVALRASGVRTAQTEPGLGEASCHCSMVCTHTGSWSRSCTGASCLHPNPVTNPSQQDLSSTLHISSKQVPTHLEMAPPAILVPHSVHST